MKAALYAIGNRRGLNVRMTLDPDVDRRWWTQANTIEKSGAGNAAFVPISNGMPLQWAVRLAGIELEAAASGWGREQWERWLKKRLGSALTRENPAEIADLLDVCANPTEEASSKDRGGRRQSALPDMEALAARAERLARFMEGRSLLRGELESLLHDLAPELAADWRSAVQLAYLQGRIGLRAAIERPASRLAKASAGEIRRGWNRLARLSVKGEAGASRAQTCARCGSAASGVRCAACGSADCARCEACRTLGRSRSCELLVQGAPVPRVMRGVRPESAGSAARLPEPRARLARWKLSPAQSAAAESALRFLEREAQPGESGKLAKRILSGRAAGGTLGEAEGKKRWTEHGARGARGEGGYGRADAARAREAAGAGRDEIRADRYAREGGAQTPENASLGGGLSAGAQSSGGYIEPLPFRSAGGSRDVAAWTAADPASRFLLWAVTGAGKTEMLFPLIESVRSRGGRVAVATPRRDVVLELAPRLRRAFPDEEIAALYGGSEERWRSGGLVLATTHQLLRFAHAFDLVVIDELDAFPFHGDPMLAYAAEAARAPGGRTVYLSATPPPELQRLVRAGRVACAKVPVRYHRHPLPVPELLRIPKTADFVRAGKLPPSLLRRWRTSLARGAQVFVFVPKIALAEPLAALLRRAFKNVPVGATSSRDEDRAGKVLSFRSAELRMLVTTTILERGVTVPRSDVYVLDADSGLFDEASLVQMAGRAGRSADDPAGAVVFAASQKTRAQSGARRQIRRMNRLARPYLLPEAARSSRIFRLPKLRQATGGAKRRSVAPEASAPVPPKPSFSDAGALLSSDSAPPVPPRAPAATAPLPALPGSARGDCGSPSPSRRPGQGRDGGRP